MKFASSLPCPVQPTRTSRNTSINSRRPPRIGKAVDELSLWVPGTRNLDIGGGRYDTLTDYLFQHHQVENLIYDPFNRSDSHNQSVLSSIYNRRPDTITLSNVLNVIDDPEVVSGLIEWSFDLLKEEGHLFVTVYEGNRTGIPSFVHHDQYQANKPTSFYVPLINYSFGQCTIRKKVIIATKITV